MDVFVVGVHGDSVVAASDRSEGDADETCYGWMASVRAGGRFCDDGGSADGEWFGGGTCGDVVEACRISWRRRHGTDAGRQGQVHAGVYRGRKGERSRGLQSRICDLEL